MANHWEVVVGGRIKINNSPEELMQQAVEYFKWCDEHPIEVKTTLKNGKQAGQLVVEEFPRPYTVKGFCLHSGVQEEYIRDLRQSKDNDSLYYHVVSRILYIIYVQVAEYATVGVYNAIFSSKMLNMQQDDTPSSAVKVEIVTGLPALSETENEILEKLEVENETILKSN